jgi:photosystem II reaction center protein Psb28
MFSSIQFFDELNNVFLKESKIPLIYLTKSENGKNGTATFIFLNSFLFYEENLSTRKIQNMSLFSSETKIVTQNLKIFFKNGKPYLLKSIFLFKNSEEWFQFLYFMSYYSKENALAFTL